MHVICLYPLPEMVEGKMFGPQWKELRFAEVKEPHHRVNNKENAFQVAPARVNLQRMNFLFTDTSPAQVGTQIFLEYFEKSY